MNEELSDENLQNFLLLSANKIYNNNNENEKQSAIKKFKEYIFLKYQSDGDINNLFNILKQLIIGNNQINTSNESNKSKNTKNIHLLILYPFIYNSNPKLTYKYIDNFLSVINYFNINLEISFLSKIFFSVTKSFYLPIDNISNNDLNTNNNNMLNKEQKKEIFQKLFSFCVHYIKQSTKKIQSLGCILLSILIETCPLIKKEPNLENTWNLISFYLKDENFKSSLDLLTCIIKLIIIAKDKFKNYCNLCLFGILDYLTDDDWIKRKISVEIVYYLSIYCKNEVLTIKDNVIEFLSALKEDSEPQVKDICLKTINLIEGKDNNNDAISIYSNGIGGSAFSIEDDMSFNNNINNSVVNISILEIESVHENKGSDKKNKNSKGNSDKNIIKIQEGNNITEESKNININIGEENNTENINKNIGHIIVKNDENIYEKDLSSNNNNSIESDNKNNFITPKLFEKKEISSKEKEKNSKDKKNIKNNIKNNTKNNKHCKNNSNNNIKNNNMDPVLYNIFQKINPSIKNNNNIRKKNIKPKVHRKCASNITLMDKKNKNNSSKLKEVKELENFVKMVQKNLNNLEEKTKNLNNKKKLKTSRINLCNNKDNSFDNKKKIVIPKINIIKSKQDISFSKSNNARKKSIKKIIKKIQKKPKEKNKFLENKIHYRNSSADNLNYRTVTNASYSYINKYENRIPNQNNSSIIKQIILNKKVLHKPKIKKDKSLEKNFDISGNFTERTIISQTNDFIPVLTKYSENIIPNINDSISSKENNITQKNENMSSIIDQINTLYQGQNLIMKIVDELKNKVDNNYQRNIRTIDNNNYEMKSINNEHKTNKSKDKTKKIDSIKNEINNKNFDDALTEAIKNDEYLYKTLPLIKKEDFPKINSTLIEDIISRLSLKLTSVLKGRYKTYFPTILNFFDSVVSSNINLKLITKLNLEDSLKYIKKCTKEYYLPKNDIKCIDNILKRIKN